MSADCLVLNIQDSNKNVYIIYDALREKYSVWGNLKQLNIEEESDRENNNNDVNKGNPFYFSCEKNNKKHLYHFIEFIMDTYVDIGLYNFKDLPNGCSEITYELLQDMDYEDNIISFYCHKKFDNKYMLNLFNILAFVRNEYYL